MATKTHAAISTNTLLDVKHLNVDYLASNGTVHAVTDVSFTLRRGEVLGLAGESGSGKSTLVYALTRLLPSAAAVTGGRVTYFPAASARAPAVGRAAAGRPLPDAGAPVDVLALSPRQLREFRWSDLAI